ncbi:MAG: hypothetical protein V2G43_02855 [bacterium JZ-2024 1]
MVLCGGMWMGGEGWAFSGPSEKPADTSSRQVEGFYPGCRWIASPKDIPVPEKVLKRIERLRGGPMIESEKDIRMLIYQWQEREFRRLSSQMKGGGKFSLVDSQSTTSSLLSIFPPCDPNRDPCTWNRCSVCGQTNCCDYYLQSDKARCLEHYLVCEGDNCCCHFVSCDDNDMRYLCTCRG